MNEITYETDILELYINNNQEVQQFWLEIAGRNLDNSEPDNVFTKDENAARILKDDLKEHYEGLKEERIIEPLDNLLHAALSSVDWWYLAKMLIRDYNEGAR